MAPSAITHTIFSNDELLPTGAMLSSRIAAMANPHERYRTFQTADSAFKLKDAGRLVSSTDERWRRTAVYRYDEDTWIKAISNKENSLTLLVINDNDDEGETAEKLLETIGQTIHELPKLPDKVVRLKFWFWSGNSPSSSLRAIEIKEWNEIRDNYSSSARNPLDQLMAVKGDDPRLTGGKILLLHGPPGTGKTTAIRALCSAWRKWCSPEYVIDPERAFGSGEYLTHILLGDGANKYRLLIMEDAEEFLVPKAKDHVGQALPRLLNLGDGLLGQGLKFLVLLTTNEALVKLHPAITRPGRCFANIQVPLLTSKEATEWLGKDSDEATLAQLYEKKLHAQIGAGITNRTKGGQYL